MKRAIGIVLAFALVLAIMPGITGDTSRAFSTMPEVTRATLAPRPDDQLATLASAKRSAGTRVRKTSRKTAIMPHEPQLRVRRTHAPPSQPYSRR